MRKKFKIMYPSDYFDQDKAGKPYLPEKGKFVAMSGRGVPFLIDQSDEWHTYMTKLSNTLPKYDVVWK